MLIPRCWIFSPFGKTEWDSPHNVQCGGELSNAFCKQGFIKIYAWNRF